MNQQPSQQPGDQLLIDRVVRAIDALVDRHDPLVADVTVLAAARGGTGAAGRPGRRWTLAAAAALVAAAVAGAVVVGGRDSDAPRPATVPSTTEPTSTDAPAPTAGGLDPRTSDPESVLPYVLDLPGAARSAVSGYSTPATGATGATLLAAASGLISIEAYPLDSDQPLPRVDGEPVAVPSGDAVWADAANVGGRLLNWWADGAQYWAWGAGVSEATVLAAVVEWDASGRPIDGFTLDAVWSGDELTYGVSYALADTAVTLQLSRWPDDITAAGPAARPTTVDGHLAWRNDDGPVVGVSWRLDDGSWMSLTGSGLTSAVLDDLLGALRANDVAPATSAGTIEVDLGDRTLSYPVIVGRDREVFRSDAVLLAGSGAAGRPSTHPQIVVVPPDLAGWWHTALEEAESGDRIRWTTPDGQVLEYVIGGYGGAVAGFDGVDDLQLTTVAGGSLSSRYLVGAERITPLGDEFSPRVAVTGADARSLSLARPDGVVTYEVAGRQFTVERGILALPSIVPTDGVCTVGMCQPNYPDDEPQVIGDQAPELGDLRVWVNVPDGVDLVRIVNGSTETWQVPVDGVAAWVAPASEDWEVTGIDVDRPFVVVFDAGALASVRTQFEQDHPELDVAAAADGPHSYALNEAAIVAVDRMRACIAAADAAVDATVMWEFCVAEGRASFAQQATAIESADADGSVETAVTLG